MLSHYRKHASVLFVGVLFSGSFFFTHTAHAAAVFNVTPTSGGAGDAACEAAPETDCSFQEALNVAQTDGVNNLIYLAAGSYTPEAGLPFSFVAGTDGKDFNIFGEDAATTFIENSDDRGLNITSSGRVNISGITFRNNALGGLFIQDYSVAERTLSILVQDCVFSGNSGPGLAVDENFLPGSILVNRDTFTGNHNPGGNGGGMQIETPGGEGGFAFPVTITDSIVEDNSVSDSGSGGGAYIFTRGDDSPIQVTGSQFISNSAGWHGGGLDLTTSGAGSWVLVGELGEGTGNSFIRNHTTLDSGGGLNINTNGSDAPVTVEANTFEGNSAYWGGGFYVDTNGFVGDTSVTATYNSIGRDGEDGGNSAANIGGGAYIWAGGGITFEHNTVTGNTAPNNGGGGVDISIDRGDFNESSNSIAYNTFSKNHAYTAGGILLDGNCNCTLSMNANRIEHNDTDSGSSGASLNLYNLATKAVITNNLIVNNESPDGIAAGMFIYANINAQGVDFVNNTVSGNHLTTNSDNYGLGLYAVGPSGEFTWNIDNNIFWNNIATIASQGSDLYFYAPSSTIELNNNVITNTCTSWDESNDLCNDASDFSPMDLASASHNVYGRNPWFMSPDDGDFHLGSISSARGAGLPTAPSLPAADYDGAELSMTPDIGALQFNATGLPVVTTGAATISNTIRVSVAGIVTDEGANPVTQTGVRYGETGGDYTEVVTQSGSVTVDESFSLNLRNVRCSTSYHYTVFATSATGTGYGSEGTFRTSGCGGSGGGSGNSVEPVIPTTPSSSVPQPHFNSYTGHWEAPNSDQMGPSPWDGSTEVISQVANGWYIRAEHYDTVYLVTADGHRRTFLDSQAFLTYTRDWSKVIWVTDATLPTLPLGPTMLAKPGVVLVKIPGEGNVYAASMDAGFTTLHKIPSEEIASSVFGANWSDYVIDVLPALFSHYVLGSDVTTGDHWDKGIMIKRADLK